MKSFFISFLARTTLFLIKLLAMTYRFEIHGFENAKKVFQNPPSITILWHDKIILTPYIFNRFLSKLPFFSIVSKSKDADLLASAIDSFPLGTLIRVPHNKRHIALKQIIEELDKKNNMIITPDGPRGPKHVIKPGSIYIARKSKAFLLPFSWSSSRSWKLKTWDRMELPKPFSKVVCIFGEPFTVKESKEGKNKLEEAMLKVTEKSNLLAKSLSH
jgi:lysophospholipid acyltransferase (LPLAT)-like uncharacterized protein